MSAGRPAAGTAPAAAAALPSAERILVLDVLRGIALVGMFVVHFVNNTNPGTSGGGQIVARLTASLLTTRFWAMFAILFGVGFAVQLRRADARGTGFTARYLRRVLALLGFGLIAELGFGYPVLVGYALWGMPLLLVRRWPTRWLVVLLVVCLTSLSAFAIGQTAYGVSRYGDAGWRTETIERTAADRAFLEEADAIASRSGNYATVLALRLRHKLWGYSRLYRFLPTNDFALFLIGMIGLRLGVFDRPREHRRLIVGLMLFGVVSWVADPWGFPGIALDPPRPGEPLLRAVIAKQRTWGFGLVREMWLAFTYIGAVLLLVASDAAWLRRFRPFASAGRMALTNYMLQVAVLDLTFSRYALGIRVSTLAAPFVALVLFAVQVAASRWWLARYQYGPLEWIWRSVTYWKRQPFLRVAPPTTPIAPLRLTSTTTSGSG
ncbi:MAG TPA: DUF418 domain-containing protein [Gemmatimonadaceae bacterium]|nr:DUF418 domain-containing protein [Gemmatimonadaceae bacterium]